jgi:hypothetical protein
MASGASSRSTAVVAGHPRPLAVRHRHVRPDGGSVRPRGLPAGVPFGYVQHVLKPNAYRRLCARRHTNRARATTPIPTRKTAAPAMVVNTQGRRLKTAARREAHYRRVCGCGSALPVARSSSAIGGGWPNAAHDSDSHSCRELAAVASGARYRPPRKPSWSPPRGALRERRRVRRPMLGCAPPRRRPAGSPTARRVERRRKRGGRRSRGRPPRRLTATGRRRGRPCRRERRWRAGRA